MDVIDALRKRRTIRRFADKEVSSDIISELIEAARLSPSGSNTQPTKIFVVKSDDTKKQLQGAGAFGQEFVHKSPLILIICGDPAEYGGESHPSLKGKSEKRCFRDLTIASSFITLRATELGLSSCWIGMLDPEVIKQTLGIPESYMLPFILCFGYAGEEPAPLSRKNKEEYIIGEK